MSQKERQGPYVYQPFGSQDKAHWDAGKIYGVATNDLFSRIEGLTKAEAEAVCEALRKHAEDELLLRVQAGARS